MFFDTDTIDELLQSKTASKLRSVNLSMTCDYADEGSEMDVCAPFFHKIRHVKERCTELRHLSVKLYENYSAVFTKEFVDWKGLESVRVQWVFRMYEPSEAFVAAFGR